MTQRRSKFQRLFLCLGLGLALSHCEKPVSSDLVLATFKDQSVTLEQFQEAFEKRRDLYSPAALKNSKLALKIKRQLIDELINQKLLLQAAASEGVSVDDGELAYEIEKYKSKYTELSFQKMLAEKGVSYEEWKKTRRENLTVSKYIASQALSEISEEDARRYYEDHPGEFKLGERVHIRQIVTDSKEKAELILRRLQNGENFAKLAKELSLSPDRKEGGDLGFISRGTFPREFEVCFSMNPGEVSPIIPSAYGFHIFKVLEKAAERQLGFEEVKVKIEAQLRQKARQELAQNLLQRLRSEAKVKVHEDVLERIPL